MLEIKTTITEDNKVNLVKDFDSYEAVVEYFSGKIEAIKANNPVEAPEVAPEAPVEEVKEEVAPAEEVPVEEKLEDTEDEKKL